MELNKEELLLGYKFGEKIIEARKELGLDVDEKEISLANASAHAIIAHFKEALNKNIGLTYIECENCKSKRVKFYDVIRNLGVVDYKVTCTECGCEGSVKEEWDL